MRTLVSFLCIGLLFCTHAIAQVKIGDSPQNIDPASVLELESNSKVLVITRVTTSQMNAINPLRGALVYNTDEGCVFYHNGTTWLNLCADLNTTNAGFELQESTLILNDSDGNSVSITLDGAIEKTFTTDPIVNFRETIIITQNGDNFNFEVGEITGENIVNSSINGIDLQNNSITSAQLAPNSVGQDELQDNTVADLEIDYSQVTLNDFLNDAGFITNVELISQDPNNAITDVNGAFYDDSPLVNNIANNNQLITDHIGLDKDLDDTNELLTNAELQGNELVLTEGGVDTRVDLSALSNTGGNNQNAAEVPFTPSAETTSTNVQDAIDELQAEITGISANGTNPNDELNQIFQVNGTNLEIIDAGGTLQVPLADITADNQQLALNDDFLTLEDGGTPIDLSIYDNSGTDNQQLSLANDLLTLEDGGAPVDLSIYNNIGTDNQNLSLSGNTINIDNGTGVDLTPILNATGSDEQDLSLSGNFLNITNGAGVDLTPILGSGGEVNDGQNVGASGVGVFSTKNGLNLEFKNINAGSTKIIVTDDAVNNEIDIDINDAALQITEAQITDLNHTVNTDDQNAGEVPFTPYVTLNALDTQNAIQQLKDELDAAVIAGGGEIPDNELNSRFEVVGGNLELTDNGGTLQVPITDIDTTLDEATVDAFANNNGYLTVEIDDDITNELQALSLTGNDLTISGGNTVILPTTVADGVVSDVSLTGTDLVFTGANGGFNATVDLASLDTTLDEATVDAFANNNGYLTVEIDDDITNELQALSLTGNDLTISGGNTVTLPAAVTDGVVSDVSLTGTDLVFTGANGGFNATVDLASLDTTLDEATVDAFANNNGYLTVEIDDDITNELQALSLTGNDLTISGGNTVTLPAAVTDGVVSDVSLTGTDLEFTGANGGFNDTVDLASLDTTLDEATVDAFANNNGYLLAEVDGSVFNEIQQLSISGNDLTITGTGGNTVTLPIVSVDAGNLLTTGTDGGALITSVNDADFDPANELQAITSTGNTLTVTPNGTDFNLEVNSVQGGASGVIVANSISQGDIGLNAIGSGEIQSDAVSSDEIDDLSILNEDIQNATIGPEKLAPSTTNNDVLTTIGGAVVWAAQSGGGSSSWTSLVNVPPGFADDTDDVDDADSSPTNELVSGLIWQESTQELQLYQAASFIGVNLTGLGPDFGAQDITTTGNLNVGGTVTVGGTQVHPDYVFEKYFNGVSLLKNDYEFMPLLQLEQYLRQNHHLPGIKSAAQVKKEQSWDLGASNIQNLEKIEELFLHTIEQEKKIETLMAANDSLVKELDSIKKDMKMIKSLLLSTKKNNE